MVSPTEIKARRPSTILLLEDDPDLSELFAATLSDAGFAVDAVENGREGLAYLAQSIPDLIVSDIMMPEMTGLEFLREIRGDPALRFVPVILLTTQSAVEDVMAGFDIGADDYLTKPVDPRELVARVKSKIDRPPVPVDAIRQDRQTGLMNEASFFDAIASELARARRGAYTCVVATLAPYELPRLRELFGPRADAALALAIGRTMAEMAGPLDLIGRAEDGSFLLFVPDADAATVERRLDLLSRTIVRSSYRVGAEVLRITPLIGLAEIPPGTEASEAVARAAIAREHAAAHLDLRPIRFEEGMRPKPAAEANGMLARLRKRMEPLRLPLQILATFVIGWLIPFGIYLLLGAIGLDISRIVYVVVVVALIGTAALIWAEGFLALRRRDPPELPEEEFGPVSAIIAAYLPNEAPTLEGTIDAFLRIDYPAETQIILAYNTPVDLPIEDRLREIARENPRFVPLRIEGSTSKAQNVNAAISMVTSPVVAIYDADHQPDPDAFRRAWRWIASGSDVVQGHCFIRNGEASWVAQTVAVEFEMIYCVSHPGRARLHDFGIFGGSNGFWRTDLLREIRMRGSMLTEDIDSALRAVEGGCRITSDPYLVSRELSPTTLTGLTNQRLRWAQGWYQVAKVRFLPSLKATQLSLRQKLGMFHLLAWREGFPWLSMQIVPIIAYWMWEAGSVHEVDWFVPVLLWISLVIFVTGPGQLYFTWRLADPSIKKNPVWFLRYLVVSILFYSGYKNILARVANIKEALGEKSWKVTPRS